MMSQYIGHMGDQMGTMMGMMLLMAVVSILVVVARSRRRGVGDSLAARLSITSARSTPGDSGAPLCRW